MLTGVKHVATGLLIGMLATTSVAIAALITARDADAPYTATATLTGWTGTSTHTPASIETHTPTPTLIYHTTATFALPTATSNPVDSALQSGGVIFTGPLSKQEQIDLYNASLTYARASASTSLAEAKTLNGPGYDGDPSNICGPLAIAILQKAGLLNADITPHDFWLLNPRESEDQEILTRAFPPDHYLHMIFSQSLNKMDWHTSPLQPGDFLFIWHGSWGNFDHMLVVNRVDQALRAYAVTNFGTSEGFLISETMLYDPNDPSIGIFHTWTRERDAILGSTGFGGFELWRKISP